MTHPFHPWFNQEFVFIGIRRAWGDNRVFFLDGESVQHSLPAHWTDVAEPDVFVVMAAGPGCVPFCSRGRQKRQGRNSEGLPWWPIVLPSA